MKYIENRENYIKTKMYNFGQVIEVMNLVSEVIASNNYKMKFLTTEKSITRAITLALTAS